MSHGIPRQRRIPDFAGFLFLASSFWILGSLRVSAIVDSNSNGLSDLWEKQYNNGVLFAGSFDANADPDADGWTNAQEAAAGADPFDPNPPAGHLRPDIARIRIVMPDPEHPESEPVQTEAIHISWATLAGKRYTLLASEDMSSQSWLPVGESFTGGGSLMTYHFPIGSASRLFFKVAVSDIDTDGDGLTDAEEHALGTGAEWEDSDGDGLADGSEIIGGTDPLLADTDGDGASDGIETAAGSDSTSASSVPAADPFLASVTRTAGAWEYSNETPIRTLYEYLSWAGVGFPPVEVNRFWVDEIVNHTSMLAGLLGTPYISLDGEPVRRKVPLLIFEGLAATEYPDGTFHYGNSLNIHAHSYQVVRTTRKYSRISGQNLRLENDWAAPATSVHRFLKVHLKAPMPASAEIDYDFVPWTIPVGAYTSVTSDPADTGVLELSILQGEKVSESYELAPPAVEEGFYHLKGLLPLDIVADYNRDGKIDKADRGKVTAAKPWRFWLNDDDDSGETGGTDISVDYDGGSTEPDYWGNSVDGIRDLIDFFPLQLDLKSPVSVLPVTEYQYFLKHESQTFGETASASSFGVVWFPEAVPDGDATGETGAGSYFKNLVRAADIASRPIHLIPKSGLRIPDDMLLAAKDGKGVILVEARFATDNPIQVEIRKNDGTVMGTVDFPVSISPVKDMLRYKFLMPGVADLTPGAIPSDPPNWPDADRNGKHFVFVHGYNVNDTQSTGWAAETFKRMFWSGSNARFTAFAWYGYQS